ncbi:MAG: hypothetical protein HQ509_05580 [Candidatus Marinimicrobia bacterium]|nr:hypothetical protein [Candidatus Neomarinimicrobiota bacterium]
MKLFISKLASIGILMLVITMCVPPSDDPNAMNAADQARLDSLRELRCPRLMSSAAEYYRNQDWKETVQIYSQLIDLGCDQWNPDYAPPEEIYLYYAIAYEFLGSFDSSEYILLKGLKVLPDNCELLKRLVYSYKRQNKLDDEIVERERIIDLCSVDTENMMELVRAYGEKNDCDRQIDILRNVLEIEPNNQIAKGELVVAYENCGRDILEIYAERCESNPDNISYCIDYADKLIESDRPEDAVNVLKSVIMIDNSSKIAFKKLAKAYEMSDDLPNASKAFEELFKIDPRDVSIALKVSEVNTLADDYGKAIRWADKAAQISNNSGDALGQKGQVYYKALSYCRSEDISDDDRIIALLAFKYFSQADEKGNRKYRGSMSWLEENDILFSKANWFMLDNDKKRRGWVKPESSCYSWVTEKLDKEPSW